MTLINCHFPSSNKTVKGHLKGQRQGIRSTKQKALEKITENKTARIKIKGKTHCSITSHSPKPTNRSSAKRTSPTQLHWLNGSLPIHFPTRQQIYHGGNPPWCKLHLCQTYAKQVKGRDDKRAYKNIINRMRLAGLGLKKHKLDNKAMEAFKQFIQEQQMQYKLVPPGNHQCNQAERTIKTFKAHFILILAGVDNKFPLSLWCLVLHKPTELTLNLLCQLKVVPKISAFAHVQGPHNYIKKTHLHLSTAQFKPTSNRRTASHET